jgi:hypothetical protein
MFRSCSVQVSCRFRAGLVGSGRSFHTHSANQGHTSRLPGGSVATEILSNVVFSDLGSGGFLQDSVDELEILSNVVFSDLGSGGFLQDSVDELLALQK